MRTCREHGREIGLGACRTGWREPAIVRGQGDRRSAGANSAGGHDLRGGHDEWCRRVAREPHPEEGCLSRLNHKRWHRARHAKRRGSGGFASASKAAASRGTNASGVPGASGRSPHAGCLGRADTLLGTVCCSSSTSSWLSERSSMLSLHRPMRYGPPERLSAGISYPIRSTTKQRSRVVATFY